MEWNGYLYASVEEAYQAVSFMESDEELVEKIKKSYFADDTYANKDKRKEDCDDVKVSIMEELLRLQI